MCVVVMSELLVKLMDREALNKNIFISLTPELLYNTITNDLRTTLQEILFELFSYELNTDKDKRLFNDVFESCLTRLNTEIDRLGHLNDGEILVWHSSVFMCLKSFRDSVESKFSLEDKPNIIELFDTIFRTSLYKFLEYNSKKQKLQTEIKEKLCDETEIHGFQYIHKKSKYLETYCRSVLPSKGQNLVYDDSNNDNKVHMIKSQHYDKKIIVLEESV